MWTKDRIRTFSPPRNCVMHCCVAFLWLRTAAPKLFAGTHCYFRSPTLGPVFGFLFWARLECTPMVQEPTIVDLCQLLPRFHRYWLVDNLGLGLVFFGSSPGTVAWFRCQSHTLRNLWVKAHQQNTGFGTKSQLVLSLAPWWQLFLWRLREGCGTFDSWYQSHLAVERATRSDHKKIFDNMSDMRFYSNQRKFRSQTSDNMERWQA